MISYIDISKTIERRTIDHVATNRVTVDTVAMALRKALKEKARRRERCSRYSHYCLLLVDVVDSIGGTEWSFWDEADLAAFDAVGLVRLDGSVCFVKGRVQR